MNCQAVQNQILGLPDPRELSPALREHVLGCHACQAWARQAARLATILEHLPVPAPPAGKKEEMLGDLMSADPVIEPMVVTAARPSFGAVALRFLRENATYVGGLAAAVLILLGVYWMWPSNGPGPGPAQLAWNDPLAQKLTSRNVALARAETPAKRLDVLNGMAEDIAFSTRDVSRIASGDDLKELARQYEMVVKDGMAARVAEIQSQPAAMPAAEKVKLFESLAAKLGADAAETEKRAGEVPPDAQQALKRMAEVAREREKALRAAAH
jgi:hypothetical protein